MQLVPWRMTRRSAIGVSRPLSIAAFSAAALWCALAVAQSESGTNGVKIGAGRMHPFVESELGAWEGDPFELEDLPGIGITSEDMDDGVHTYTSA